MLIDICIKFREYSLSGFQVIERTQFVTDRQTDRRTDGQTDRQTDARGKTICLPTLKGGDIIKQVWSILYIERSQVIISTQKCMSCHSTPLGVSVSKGLVDIVGQLV